MITAIERGIPTKVCGEAAYAINGLYYNGSINSFWKKARVFKVDMAIYYSYKQYLMYQTKINGNFYKRISSSPLKSGLLLGNQGH